MNHQDWQERLRNACAKEVRLPSKHLTVTGAVDARLHLSGRAVCENMQHDWAAFEGWALALLTWGGASSVTLAWDEPEGAQGVADPHYQRFLYRVERFCALVPEVRIEDANKLQALRVHRHLGRFVVNAAQGKETAEPQGQSEAALEKKLTTPGALHDKLKAMFLLDKVDRQFPVGVFEGKVSRATTIFPRAKSAIDLVATDSADHFWVIELKLKDNRKVGAVSELFFYAMVLQDLQRGVLQGDKPAGARALLNPTHVVTAPKLHARLLMEAGRPHPLVADKVLDLLTKRVGTIDFAWASLA